MNVNAKVNVKVDVERTARAVDALVDLRHGVHRACRVHRLQLVHAHLVRPACEQNKSAVTSTQWGNSRATQRKSTRAGNKALWAGLENGLHTRLEPVHVVLDGRTHSTRDAAASRLELVHCSPTRPTCLFYLLTAELIVIRWFQSRSTATHGDENFV